MLYALRLRAWLDLAVVELWRYLSVWVGFLYTQWVRLPSSFLETSTLKNKMLPSFSSSNVNMMLL